MSDFEQWAENDDYAMNLSIERDEDGRYRDIHIENMLRGWNAAIASMQGESVAYCGEDHLGNLCNFTTDKPISGWHKPLFTYPPSAESKIAEQDARIKELEQQLEVARKDAERWQSATFIYADNPHTSNYHKATLSIPWLRVEDYTRESYNKAFDAALRHIQDAEQDAEIARLQKELEVARKDAERWNAILHSGAYSPSDFGNPIGFAGRTGQYTKEQLNASADAYIIKHCNSAILQIGGAE